MVIWVSTVYSQDLRALLLLKNCISFFHGETISFVMIFPHNSRSFPGSKNSTSVIGFSRFVATLHKNTK